MVADRSFMNFIDLDIPLLNQYWLAGPSGVRARRFVGLTRRSRRA